MKFSIALSLSILTTATGQESPGDSRNLHLRAAFEAAAVSSSASGVERKLPGNPDRKGSGPCKGICNAYNNADCIFDIPTGDCSSATKVTPVGNEASKGCERLCTAYVDFTCASDAETVCEEFPPTCAELTTTGTDVSCWTDNGVGETSGTLDQILGFPYECGLTYSITGSGQCNSGFTVYEYNGVQVGIRITKRGPAGGPITPSADGVYTVNSGEDPSDTSADIRSWWNFDYHVDLRDAPDTTIDNFLPDGGLKLSVACIGDTCPANFGPYVDIPLSPVDTGTQCFDLIGNPNDVPIFGSTWTFFQQSQNFGFTYWPWIVDSSYDVDLAGVMYELTLQLGDLCPITITVDVVSGTPDSVATTCDVVGLPGACTSDFTYSRKRAII